MRMQASGGLRGGCEWLYWRSVCFSKAGDWRVSFETINLAGIDRRLLPVQLGVIASFLCVPFWLRMPYAPTTYDPLYGFGFLLAIPMTFTVLAWIFAAMPGIGLLWQDKTRRYWLLALVALAVWMHLSVSWSFIGEERGFANVAQGAAIRFTLVVAWIAAVTCAGPPPRVAAGTLVFGAAWTTLIAILQVHAQSDIGLGALGEFTLDPARSGTSVLESGGERWLRPYALLPHPNPLGGLLLVGLLSTLGFILSRNRRLQIVGIIAAGWIFYGLLLTFSRSAWLGFAAGAVMVAPVLLRLGVLSIRKQAGVKNTGVKNDAPTGRSFVIALGVMAMVGGVFAVNYSHLIIARTGAGTEGVEVRSLSERLVFTLYGYRAATENLWLGVGAGNFPWRASYYLVETDYDLRGDNVHHVYLSALAETGLVGLALLTVAVVLGVEGVLRRIKAPLTPTPQRISVHAMLPHRQGRGASINAEQDPLPASPGAGGGAKGETTVFNAALLAGFAGLALAGLFDHYPWTLLQFQALWWALVAVGGRD